METLRGWLFDLYADAQEGLILWFLGEDGRRLRLHQRFPITFYAAGENASLRSLWKFLSAQKVGLRLSRREGRDLFQPQPIPVLAVEVENPAAQPGLFYRIARAFPDLTYYDADLPLGLRHAAIYDTFPFVHCELTVASDNVESIVTLETPWDLEPSHPPLRILSIQPDANPKHAEPASLTLQYENDVCKVQLEPARPMLMIIRSILMQYDPDIILSAFGDTWLIPYLLERCQKWDVRLPLNRDDRQQITFRKERSYFSYGQVIYRGQQAHLFGRIHIDGGNAVMFHEYGMDGVLELGRVTSLGLQTAARTSPGTGISSMQITTALRKGVLVPWHKQQAEFEKTALDLLDLDRGGLVFQPTVGLHGDVAEIDFISMYPSIMARFNISPETVSWKPGAEPPEEPEPPGLIPQTLAPLLEKRIELKHSLGNMARWDERRVSYEARASAHKWLLVTCFGYLGYKNARFGRIEAHEAVTHYGREALLLAKEAAEDFGFTVLHMYVDGLWVKKKGCNQPGNIQPLLETISRNTGLPIALDGIYRWVVFMPSRIDEHMPVANRYFGVFQDGSIKMRGIEARRRDTPRFIVRTQLKMLEILAQARDVEELPHYVPLLRRLYAARVRDLVQGNIPLEDLLVSLRASRTLEEFRTPSPVAQALIQLREAGKEVRPGQSVRIIYTLGSPSVYAWDGQRLPERSRIDTDRYARLLKRATDTILEGIGACESAEPARGFLSLPKPEPAVVLNLSQPVMV